MRHTISHQRPQRHWHCTPNLHPYTTHCHFSASDGADGDFFGYSVSISGGYAIVGAFAKYCYRGAAYIYHRSGGNNWTDEAIIAASDGDIQVWFGYSVSISGDYAIVGVFRKNSGRGAAYVYHRSGGNNWGDEAIITASNGAADDTFGSAVAISGVNTMVGASGKDSNRGTIYAYQNCSLGYKIVDGGSCEPCDAGTYSNSIFAISCLTCPPGSYCLEASSSPTLCSYGTHSDEGGRTTDCPLCSAGSYCATSATKQTCIAGVWCAEGSTNQSTLCPSGHYCLIGDSLPRPCTLGRYCGSSEGRSADGDECAGGFYCPTVTHQIQCPAGSACPSGTVTPMPCTTAGYYCAAGSASAVECSQSCPADKPYVVGECTSDNDLRCSATAVVLDNRSFEIPWLLLGLAVCLLSAVLIASKTLKRYYPHSHPMRMFAFVFAVVDLASDIVFIVHIHGVIVWAFRAAVAVFVVCIVLQGAYIAHVSAIWMNRGEFRDYVLDRPLWFALVWVISTANIESLLVLSSRVFHLDMCSAPLTRQQEHRIMSVGGVGVVFESIPQFIIQLLVALELKELSGPVGFALLITVIQLVISISKYAWLCVARRKSNGCSKLNSNGTEVMSELDDDSGGRLLTRVMASDDLDACVDAITADMSCDEIRGLLKCAIGKLCEQRTPSNRGDVEFVSGDHRQSIMEMSTNEVPNAAGGDQGGGLPLGWCKYVSDTGVPYYFNQSMGMTQWEPPASSS